jgi:hypothetical protein
MYWSVRSEVVNEAAAQGPYDGRFVLHRHNDSLGPHLDLRLEQDGYLAGWRVDGLALEERAFATQKPPHPLHWLDQDGDAIREDAGHYRWERRDDGESVVVLHGRNGAMRVRFAPEAVLAPAVAHDVAAVLEERGLPQAHAARLVADGIAARTRAIERFCGLGRELDGEEFEDGLSRKMLRDLSLEEIHSQLRALERRFDAAHPPIPVSQPERLPGEPCERQEQARAIARGA